MDLNSFFYPTSVAVIGASTKSGSVGNDVVKNLILHDYQGKIYPVNPNATELFDLPCYAKIQDIKQPIGIAIIIIPAKLIPQILEDLGHEGVHSAVIISAGFKEAGPEGQVLEKTVQEICQRYDITLLGPNCLGFINAEINFNASFAPLMPALGNISLLSQSGALCTAILDSVHENNLGFSKFISTGNKASLNENALLKYLAQDEGTQVIAMYAEELADAQDIISTGKAVIARSVPKPIIAIKAGLTAAGASASASHTGSLGGSAAAYQALFTQGKIIQAETLGEFFNLLYTFSRNALPQGNKIAIITNAGGPGVLATDACDSAGLILAKLSSETEAALKNVLPASAGIHNPVDVLGDAKSDRYQAAISIVAEDRGVDMMLIMLTPQSMTDIEAVAEAIIDIKKKTTKPIVTVFVGDTLVRPGRAKLHAAQIATLKTPEEGAQTLGSLARVAAWHAENHSTITTFDDIDKDKVTAIIKKARDEKRSNLFETEVWDILFSYGFPRLQSTTANSPEDAQEKAAIFGDRSIAFKIISPDITHKSDAGGVMLNVQAKNAAEAYTQLLARVAKNVPTAKLEGALMVEMAESNGSKEIILGTKKEPGLGTLLMFGLGGIYVETFKDVAFRFAPMTSADIEEMMRETKTFPLLSGTRGEAGVDIGKLAECIGRLSQLVTDFPEIEECDINPLRAFPNADDFRFLDGRITLS
ncbi:MAG: acetate--CoA ligase family protein [Candidatus Moranbacteria bacterium]|nr:acetate--CoA ligase family protein [Candidatus Moranbacteria bacterium]